MSKTRLEAGCGSDHELLIAKFRLKLKKVGKTTRPFRYDLNQIPYDYTVEMRNRFKELDLIECLKNYGQRFVTLYRRPWSRPSPRKRKAKWLPQEVLQIAEKRRGTKGKGELSLLMSLAENLVTFTSDVLSRKSRIRKSIKIFKWQQTKWNLCNKMFYLGNFLE